MTTTQVSPLDRPGIDPMLIRQAPLFALLPTSELQHLADTLEPHDLAPGAFLFRENDYGDHFFIVGEGQIEIIKSLGTPEERQVSVRGPGDYVGEMSLLNRDGARTASARTLTAARVLVMTRADFDALLQRQPALSYEMLRVLSHQLAEAHNSTIRDLREKNQQLTEAYETLKAAQAQIIEKEKLEHELQVAHAVQASLLPHQAPVLPGWQFATRWHPAREVSGDFYDFIPLASSPRPQWGLVMADVTDKGMPAALFMAVTRSIIRASASQTATPAECLTQVNRLVAEDAAQGMFVTVFYAQLDPRTGALTYVNAGHNPPWLYCAEQERWLELTRTGIAVGLLDAAEMKQATVQLNSGDILLLYTDGLTDATNVAGERFGVEGIRQALQSQLTASAAEMAETLEAAVNDFRQTQLLFDDITVMIVKRISPPAGEAA